MENSNVNVQAQTAAPSATNGNGQPQPQPQPQPSQPSRPASYVRPRAHIVENGDDFVLQVELPGVRKDGLEVTFENGELAIVGHRAPFQTEAELIYRESRPAEFPPGLRDRSSIDTAKIGARLEQGVLTLTLPKAESAKPRRIEVQPGLN